SYGDWSSDVCSSDLANRISPPTLVVCLPFVQLIVSPYVQRGVLSLAVAVMFWPIEPPVNPAAPPKQFPGGRAPVIGLQTGKGPEIGRASCRERGRCG